MTKKSAPVLTTVSENRDAFFGDKDPATGTPAARISVILAVMSSALIGSE